MKKTSRLFIGILLAIICVFFSACMKIPTDVDPDTDEPYDEKIIIPDAPAGTDVIKFSSITYQRPSFTDIEQKYLDAIASVELGVDFDECIEKIGLTELSCENFMTMYSYATIKAHANAADEYFSGEYAHLAESYPALIKLEEELLVAAANSRLADRLESEYFGEGLLAGYENGGIYTDLAISLLEKEAELVAEYNSLSTASVTITYGSRTDTLDGMLSYFKKLYGETSERFLKVANDCTELYYVEENKASKRIFVELVTVRREIADALGYDSYTDYAYEVLSHGYSPEEMEAFIYEIAKYAVPVYQKLSVVAFKSPLTKKVGKGTVVNTLTKVMGELDPQLSEIYAYMLYSDFFDVDSASENRFTGSFTTYLDKYGAPYLFVTAAGDASDYMTLSHEFGHFYDYYVNGGEGASIDLMEVSSQALELLALGELRNEMSQKDYSRLFKHQMKSVLETLIFQAFYAKFEHLVYELSADEITEERINELVSEAAEAMSMNGERYNDLSYVMVSHIFNSPFYVQSYTTSALTALEIFFAEKSNSGEGVRLYRELVNREDICSYLENLEVVGLSTPFSDGIVKEMCDEIHFSIIGSHFFEDFKKPAIAIALPPRVAA